MAGYLLSLMAHIAKTEFSNTNRNVQTMQDNLLRLQKAAYQVTLDTGGMFKDKLKVVIDPDESSMPYLAVAEDGWGRCVCRRYATKQEAIDNLERLHDKL